MTERGKVRVGGTTKEYELREFVRERARWIPGRIAEAQNATPLGLVDGETLPYLGRSLRMVVKRADVRSPQARFGHWQLRITPPHGASVGVRREMVLSAVAAWCRARAEDHVRASVERWRHRFGVSAVPPVLIGDQRSFWGSCSPDGTLRFSWRTMMLEPTLIDYIVVHELAHLEVMNHSKAFWALVYKVMPDALQRRRRLREDTRGIPLWPEAQVRQSWQSWLRRSQSSAGCSSPGRAGDLSFRQGEVLEVPPGSVAIRRSRAPGQAP